MAKKPVKNYKDAVASLLASPVEAKANKWALYGLAALLFIALASWGGREYHLNQQASSASAAAKLTEAKLETTLDKLTLAEHATLSLAEQLKVEKSSHNSKRTGRRVVNADGSTVDEWADEDASYQETIDQARQQAEELTRNLIASRDEVSQLTTMNESLIQELASSRAEVKRRSHSPISVAVGADQKLFPYIGLGYGAEILGVNAAVEANVLVPWAATMWKTIYLEEDNSPKVSGGIRLTLP